MIKNLLTFSFLVSFLVISCTDKKTTTSENRNSDSLSMEIETPNEEIEEYRTMDSKTLERINAVIASKNLNTAQAVLNAYAPKDDNNKDEDYVYEVTKMKSDANTTLLLLVEDNMQNDSLKARKVLMRIEYKDNKLKVTQIKESYQCWEWRGHQDWSAVVCQ